MKAAKHTQHKKQRKVTSHKLNGEASKPLNINVRLKKNQNRNT